jgi:hypothetical protein
MDCNHARLLLEVAHPIATELDARTTEQLAAHLLSCPQCGVLAESGRLADEQLTKAMRDVPVPVDLKFRLLNRLRKERDAWYGGWLLRGVGVAAALVLAVGLSYATWRSHKPEPNLEILAADTNQALHSPDLVKQAFKAKGVTMEAPDPFDYNKLDSCGMAEFQGKRVPYLLFIHNGDNKNPVAAKAMVYVLSDRDFNLDAAQKPMPGTSQPGISQLTFAAQPGYLYVVVHTPGRKLEEFFKPTKPHA